MIEAQINYIAQALLFMDKHNLQSIEIKQNVHDKFNENLQLNAKRSVWQTTGCFSLFQDVKGNNTAIWPVLTWIYVLLMKHFDHENYILQT